ncbi:hypothetical protein [Pseudalkalibacillus decolorationis]|uniref:hypothetical protein n=1 Tax=Pseudalkalibacillus decolorationis TaxID=163879 RepID=UPI0021486DF0|nr:hypothetical protein [Pseudalkalibacillus decolorationis]
MRNKHVYVLLTDTGTLFTRMIKLYTKCPFNHASIAFDNKLEELYSFGRKDQSNPFVGGFVKENIETELFRRAKCAVYRCSVTEFEYHLLRRNIQKYERSERDYKYNLLGLFGILFNIEINRKNAFFCSQFVATLLDENGLSVVDKPLTLVTPNDFKVACQLSLVYEGELRIYPSVRSDKEERRILTPLVSSR